MKLFEGSLAVDRTTEHPVGVFAEGTSLHAVHDGLVPSDRQILITDIEGHLLGFVSADTIRSRMTIPDGIEQKRWREMPIESLLPTKLESPSECTRPASTGQFECTPIFENDRLVGMLAGGDALISWDRVAPMLNRVSADTVTGLPNRYGFERRLEEELNRTGRTQHSIGVVMADIDFFKQFNDTYGHLVGDAVLRAVGACMTQSLRSYDYVARFAGDEFAAICIGCRPDEIDIPLQRMQQCIQSVHVEGVDGDISLSIGAVVAHCDEREWTPSDLIHAADECLYFAKRNGRNCAYRQEFGAGKSPVIKVGSQNGTMSPICADSGIQQQ